MSGLVAAPVDAASSASTAVRRTTTGKSATTTPKKAAYSAKAARARAAQARPVLSAAAARAGDAPTAEQSRSSSREPGFKFDDSGALVPDINAAAAIIYNPQNGQVLWESHSQDQRSIASITKVMTAIVLLEDEPDLSERVVVQRADVARASTTYLRAGDRVTKEDLLHLLLIASDNAAARALARTSPHGAAGFIARMNSKAAELDLTSTRYADPSGLVADNVSSAYDMARLIAYVSSDPRIAGIMQKKTYTATAGRRAINIRSTNQLVRTGDVDVQAGKTGFIRKAGYCLATLLRLPQTGQEIAVVVLGARSSAGRWSEVRHLANWLSTAAGDLLGGTPVEAATTR